jgi:hyperosmotically inducible periplasmic protein
MNRTVLLFPALALSATLVACNRADNGQTAGTAGDRPAATSRSDAPPQARTESPTTSTTTTPSGPTAAQKAGNAVSDSTITAEVKSALAADPQLSALRIEVDTNNGVVTLTGPAPNEQAKSRATQIAAGPKGVMRVENRLEVKSS